MSGQSLEQEHESDYDDERLEAQRATHVHSSDEKDAILRVDVNEEVIELNNLRIFSFDELELDKLTNCTVLELRKNLLHKLMPFPANLRANLLELDLFDNKIRHIGPYFSHCDSPAFMESKLPHLRPDLLASNGGTGCAYRCLRKLDLSYNQISSIAGLDDLGPTLEELYLVENKIKVVQGLSKLTSLKLLELGGNQIRSVASGLEALVNLEQLWLGKNKIDTIGPGFVTLRKLKRLSLQANRLTSIPVGSFPAGAHPQLTELYLSENGLTEIANVEALSALTLLDVSFNPIASLFLNRGHDTADKDEGLDVPQTVLTPINFPELEEFWLTDGKIENWNEIKAVFEPFASTLRTIYLERNPIERDKRYRNKVLLALPFVDQIDSWPVVNRDDPEQDRAIRR
uniref:Protein phosphatase 1 regulatory subunit 7 n=1 Tax=Neobodo designis TaxID=312471 RepID=A0A7S1MTT3_NEODS